MPKIELVLYRGDDGTVPLLDWFETLVPKARAKCRVKIERLAELGHQLRRSEAGYLRDNIYELRAKHAGVNYRMLYFFHGQTIVFLSHGFSKQRAEVPKREICLALRRKETFEEDPEVHTHSKEG